MEYEAVIGLEVHVQLKTKSKMFTSVEYKYAADENVLTNEVIWAFPGVLPVLNKEAIDKTVEAGLLLNCTIAEITKWDRKNYFYPDSPKNYQLTQYDQPVCMGGSVEIELAGQTPTQMGFHRDVALTRIHLEEDVGKLTHNKTDSLVDYNRAGVPLMEIVTEPDMFSSAEVFAFLTSLRNIISNAGISDCDMEKGQMRCDVNISVREKGTQKLGTKVEMKNMNSISNVKNCIDYEIKRQIDCIKKSIPIIQETRRWDADLSITQAMRTKEDAHDYRYFPDPDLMPVKIEKSFVENLKKNLMERPFDRQRRYIKDYSLPYSITSVMCVDLKLSNYFEEALKVYGKNPQGLANLVINDLLRELSKDESATILDCKISPQNMAGLVSLIDEGVISKQIAKDVFVEMYETSKSAKVIVEEKGLKQNSNSDEIEVFCKQALEADPKTVAEYKAGNQKALNALVGPVMKASKGKANPAMLMQILKKLIG